MNYSTQTEVDALLTASFEWYALCTVSGGILVALTADNVALNVTAVVSRTVVHCTAKPAAIGAIVVEITQTLTRVAAIPTCGSCKCKCDDVITNKINM